MPWVRRAAVDSQERELRLSVILTTASPDIFKQSTLLLVCIPFDRTGSLVALSTKAKKFSWGEEFQA